MIGIKAAGQQRDVSSEKGKEELSSNTNPRALTTGLNLAWELANLTAKPNWMTYQTFTIEPLHGHSCDRIT